MSRRPEQPEPEARESHKTAEGATGAISVYRHGNTFSYGWICEGCGHKGDGEDYQSVEHALQMARGIVASHKCSTVEAQKKKLGKPKR